MKKASKMGDSERRDDVLKRLLLTKPRPQKSKKERITAKEKSGNKKPGK